MRIHVDRDRCTGNAVCVGEAPDLFDIDDYGEVSVLDQAPPDDQREAAERAAYMCPTQALSVTP